MGSWYYIVDGEFAAYALKIYITLERMRNYVHTISRFLAINAIKKIGAPLLGLAKYIYY